MTTVSLPPPSLSYSSSLVPSVPSVEIKTVVSTLLGIDPSSVEIKKGDSRFPVIDITTGFKSLVNVDKNYAKASSQPSRNNPNLYLKRFAKKSNEEIESEEWMLKYERGDYVDYDESTFIKHSKNKQKIEDKDKKDSNQMNEYLQNMDNLNRLSSHVYSYEPYILDTEEGYVLMSRKVDGIPLATYLDNVVVSYNSKHPEGGGDESVSELVEEIQPIMNNLHDVAQDLLNKANFVHNDAHFYNVLINKDTKHLTLIDIEPESFSTSTGSVNNRLNNFKNGFNTKVTRWIRDALVPLKVSRSTKSEIVEKVWKDVKVKASEIGETIVGEGGCVIM